MVLVGDEELLRGAVSACCAILVSMILVGDEELLGGLADELCGLRRKEGSFTETAVFGVNFGAGASSG